MKERKFKPIASYKPGCKECIRIASQRGQPFRRTELGDRNSWYGRGAYKEEINHLIEHPELNPTVFGVILESFSYLVYDYYNNGNCNLVSIEPVEEECAVCLGEGEQECWACNGDGEDWEGDECDRCNGSGMVECEPCFGMGEQEGGYEVTGIEDNRYIKYIQPIYDLTNKSSAGSRVRDAMYRLESALENGILNEGHNKAQKPLFSPQKDKLYTDLGDAIGFYIINEPNALIGGNDFINYMAEDFNAEMILRKESCCCGATVKSPCLCMFKGVMKCSANKPMCPCYKEIAMGTKVEMEHTKSKEKAEKIAKEHLAEHPDYYSRLKKAGLADELKGHMSFAESFNAEDKGASFIGIEEFNGTMSALFYLTNHKKYGSVIPIPLSEIKIINTSYPEFKNNGAESFEADWHSVNCIECGKSGYSDEMTKTNGLYLCVRCANPHIDFSKYNSEGDTFYEVVGIKPMAKGGKRWVIENELGVPIGDFDSITEGKRAAVQDYAKKSKKHEGMMFWPPALFGKSSPRKSNKGYTIHRNASENYEASSNSWIWGIGALAAGFMFALRRN